MVECPEVLAAARRRGALIAQLQARVFMRDHVLETGLTSMSTGRVDVLNKQIDSLLEELWQLSHPKVPSPRAVRHALAEQRQ